MSTATTVKVSKDLRDRIAREAATRGVSAAELIAELLDEQDRRARLAAVRAAYAVRGADNAAEVAAWDGLSDEGA